MNAICVQTWQEKGKIMIALLMQVQCFYPVDQEDCSGEESSIFVLLFGNDLSVADCHVEMVSVETLWLEQVRWLPWKPCCGPYKWMETL